MSPDALERIAEAVEVKESIHKLHAQVESLTAVVGSNLAEQQRLNSRMDQTVAELGKAMQDTRQRLVAVECKTEKVGELEQRIAGISERMARYVGMGTGAAIVISTVITVAVKIWG